LLLQSEKIVGFRELSLLQAKRFQKGVMFCGVEQSLLHAKILCKKSRAGETKWSSGKKLKFPLQSKTFYF
jgi:hypothetical protein